MPDIAEKTSQDANVVQQQQKKQIIPKKRRSKLFCFLFLFLFKKELKNVLKSRKTKNYRRFIWTICPRPKTTKRLHASRHGLYSETNSSLETIGEQFLFFSNDFFFKHGHCHNGKRRRKGDGALNSSNTFALIWVRSIYLFCCYGS